MVMRATAESGSVRAPILPGAADTASAKLLRQGLAGTDTTSSRKLPSPAATGAARALSLDPALVTLEMLPFVKLRSGRTTQALRGAAAALRVSCAIPPCSIRWRCSAYWRGSALTAPPGPSIPPASLSASPSPPSRTRAFSSRWRAGLQSNGIAPDTVGFEISEPLCTQRRAQVEHFMAGCEKLGCFVVIDDFSFDSAVVPLLRSRALRLVKIDGRLTDSALRDKLSQALVVAMVQAVKVLGMHCAAQQVDSQPALQWLSAVGCDFAQGPMVARQQPLETLLGTAS